MKHIYTYARMQSFQQLEEKEKATKEKAVAAIFKMKILQTEKDSIEKSTGEEKTANEALIGKLRSAVEKARKEVKISNDKYEEIVKWAKATEETQRKHDDELKKGMVQQHEKFNVEYDFLNKENTALKDEIRNMKNEVADHKSLLKQSLQTIKNLHRDNDEKVSLADKAAKRTRILDMLCCMFRAMAVNFSFLL